MNVADEKQPDVSGTSNEKAKTGSSYERTVSKDKKNAEKTRKCDAVFAYSVHLSTETGSKLILLEIPFDISTEGNTFVK